MEGLSRETISFLQYLLPGFVAAWIFYGLTSYPKPSQFERVIQALIFTLFVKAFLYVLMDIFLHIGHYLSLGVWDDSSNLVWSLIIAIVLGLLFSYYTNNDKIHLLA
jgi:fructose-specific phosphotransferase system IIC component